MRSAVVEVWREDRWAILVIAAGSLVSALVWGATTRPMGDSAGYRAAGVAITEGWGELTERTPLYPLLLWLTGSLGGETPTLFLTQLLMHAVAVLLVVRIGGGLGLPRAARIAVAVLLVMPPPMVKVVYSGSEALTELLVVFALWCFVRWFDTRRTAQLIALGGTLGLLTWARPTFQLVWVPVAVMVVLLVRPGAGTRRAVAAATAVAAPAVLLVGVLVLHNGARFDSWGTTPLFGWFLGSRTSAFVEELPESEPLRDLMIDERNRRMLLGPETDAENYAFGIRDEIGEITGLDGVELDRRMLQLNVGLIVSNPFQYSAAVNDSLGAYVQIDAEPAASGPGQLGGWAQSLVHPLLMVLFLIPAVTVPGLVLRGDVDRRTVVVLTSALVIAGYVAVVSTLVQTGSPRLRAPTDPLLVLVMVTGWWLVRQAWVARRLRANDGPPTQARVADTT